MRSLIFVLALCGLYGVMAQDESAVPGMPPVEEAAGQGMLPEMPGPVIPNVEDDPFDEETKTEETTEEGPEEEEAEGEEDTLVRCKRPMCRMFCPYGFRSGKDGCPICSCLENPCATVECEANKVCKPLPCKQLSCSYIEAECVELPRDCPLYKCARNCESGYVKDKHGCSTCECIEEEAVEVGTKVPPPIANSPPIYMPCPMPMCAEMCPFGMKTSERGCMTCECNEEPLSCEGMACDEGLQCYMKKPKDCTGCPSAPKCTVPSLCANMQAMHNLMGVTHKQATGMPMGMDPTHKPLCREDGTFSPTQCHAQTEECWCVDDRGREVEGTRMAGSQDCAENTTSTLHMNFILEHNFDEDELIIIIKSRDIHLVIQEHLGKWLSMNKDNVIIISVIPNGDTITVETVIMSDGVTDLPSAANHVGHQMNEGKCNIDYRGKTLKPKTDSVTVHNQYRKPALPQNGGLHEWRGFCHRHRSAMIAGSVGAIIFLMMMITLIVYVCKRRRSASAQFAHKRFENMENFKKNLIHSRDWEQPDLVVAEKENKNVQLISKEPIV